MAKRFSLLLLLSVMSLGVMAQSFYAVRRDRTLIFSAGTGTSTYFGELSNPGDYLDAKPNLNIGLHYPIGPRLGVRAEINWFQLAGSDANADNIDRKARNLSFQSNNYEISFTGLINLFPKGNRYYQRPAVNAYAFVGIGYLFFNPTAELNGTRYALQPLMTEGVKYSRSQFVVPYGLGVRLKAGPFFNFVVEGGYRTTFTDYLDDVSTVHPDKASWTDPVRIALSDRRSEVGKDNYAPGTRRGNPGTNDGYMLFNAKIEYFLPTNFLFKNSSRSLYRSKRKISRRRR